MEIKIDSFIDSITTIYIRDLSFTKNGLLQHGDSQIHIFELSGFEREAPVLSSRFFPKCII